MVAQEDEMHTKLTNAEIEALVLDGCACTFRWMPLAWRRADGSIEVVPDGYVRMESPEFEGGWLELTREELEGQLTRGN
jgi:hypothetical protein